MVHLVVYKTIIDKQKRQYVTSDKHEHEKR